MTNTAKKPPTSGPLAGVRVIEMSALGPVPFAGMMLADMGAEVIRIERAGAPPPGLPMDQRFDIMSRGKRSIALDLKHPRGRELVLQFAENADILLEGMRPGAMERLGLGPDVCMQRNSRLVYGRMTGWGQTGPLAQTAGHDINYIALNGVLHSIGLAGGPPVPPANLVGDYGGGAMFLQVGVLAALLESRISGQGQVIDAAMLEGASYLMTTLHMFSAAGMWQPQRGTNLLDTGAPFYAVYATSDGQHMAVGAIEPKFYADFVKGLDLDIAQLPAQMDRGQWNKLKETFAACFLRQTRDQWTAIFEHRDACVTPVLSMQEASAHAHNRERGNFVEIDELTQPNMAPRFGRTAADVRNRPSSATVDSRTLLQELRLSSEQIDALIAENVVQART
jgi:alpha-methylacyl-CoA racemase